MYNAAANTTGRVARAENLQHLVEINMEYLAHTLLLLLKRPGSCDPSGPEKRID
jgi:hypothetical protein